MVVLRPVGGLITGWSAKSVTDLKGYQRSDELELHIFHNKLETLGTLNKDCIYCMIVFILYRKY